MASPLGLWLLCAVHLDGHHDAQPLIDPTRYPDADTIQHHLLEERTGWDCCGVFLPCGGTLRHALPLLSAASSIIRPARLGEPGVGEAAE